jgi:hypothetical protein
MRRVLVMSRLRIAFLRTSDGFHVAIVSLGLHHSAISMAPCRPLSYSPMTLVLRMPLSLLLTLPHIKRSALTYRLKV